MENKNLPALTEVDYGERIPPDGASSDSPPPFVQRIEVKAEINKTAPPNPQKSSTSSAKKKKKKVLGGEDITDLLEAPAQSEEDDGFSNLRKLLSEGRITGLNDKPPSFVPPTPPATAKPVGGSGSNASTPVSKKIVPSNSSAGEIVKKKMSSNVGEHSAPSSAKKRTKPPAPKPARSQSQSNISRTAATNLEKQPSRKSKEAPKPPGQSSLNNDGSAPAKALVNGNDVKFLSSRLRESVEDLTQMDARRRAAVRGTSAEIKRSPSNHETKTSKLEKKSLFLSKFHCVRIKLHFFLLIFVINLIPLFNNFLALLV